mmetsp:Transcript_22759/g.67287  ORF Transcript_22759/g.67287 Transcript_22759/m.67287 type:complete len:84 (+) Transcript_22759:1389-1640(+)
MYCADNIKLLFVVERAMDSHGAVLASGQSVAAASTTRAMETLSMEGSRRRGGGGSGGGKKEGNARDSTCDIAEWGGRRCFRKC